MPDDPTQTDPVDNDQEPKEPEPQEPEPSDGMSPEDWDSFLEAQPENIQALYQTHTKGLRSALESERESRKQAEAEMRRLADEAEEGSQAKKDLEKLVSEQAESNRRAAFLEQAVEQRVANPRLAYIAAREDGFISDEGETDFEGLKEKHPQLFTQAKPKPPDIDANDGGGDRPKDRSATLTADEQEMAKKMGLSQEQYLAAKRGET